MHYLLQKLGVTPNSILAFLRRYTERFMPPVVDNSIPSEITAGDILVDMDNDTFDVFIAGSDRGIGIDPVDDGLLISVILEPGGKLTKTVKVGTTWFSSFKKTVEAVGIRPVLGRYIDRPLIDRLFQDTTGIIWYNDNEKMASKCVAVNRKLPVITAAQEWGFNETNIYFDDAFVDAIRDAGFNVEWSDKRHSCRVLSKVPGDVIDVNGHVAQMPPTETLAIFHNIEISDYERGLGHTAKNWPGKRGRENGWFRYTYYHCKNKKKSNENGDKEFDYLIDQFIQKVNLKLLPPTPGYDVHGKAGDIVLMAQDSSSIFIYRVIDAAAGKLDHFGDATTQMRQRWLGYEATPGSKRIYKKLNGSDFSTTNIFRHHMGWKFLKQFMPECLHGGENLWIREQQQYGYELELNGKGDIVEPI